jgi:MoaA/NifB/PqqE/SkfB family radical SAM enzyme
MKMTIHDKLETYLALEMARREDVLNRRDTVSSPPSQFYVEPTNICNHDCIMCAPKAKRGKPGYMSMDLWRRIVDNLHANGFMPPTTLIGRGEPLLHKRIVDIVGYGSRHNIPCFIITNGALLDEPMARGLLDAGVKKLQVSLNAHTQETHRTISRRDTYSAVMANTHGLLETIEKGGYNCHVSVMACDFDLTRNEIDDFKAYWTPRVDRVFTTEVYAIQGHSRYAGTARSRKNLLDGHPGCMVPWYFIGARWDGTLTPCPFDFEENFVIGNAADDGYDMMTAWNQDACRRFRQSHLERDFSFTDDKGYPCRACEVPRTVDACKGIPEWIDLFHKAFARVYAPLIR